MPKRYLRHLNKDYWAGRPGQRPGGFEEGVSLTRILRGPLPLDSRFQRTLRNLEKCHSERSEESRPSKRHAPPLLPRPFGFAQGDTAAHRVTWSEESLAGELVTQRSLFTGMTGFGTVLCVDGKVEVVNRRAI